MKGTQDYLAPLSLFMDMKIFQDEDEDKQKL